MSVSGVDLKDYILSFVFWHFAIVLSEQIWVGAVILVVAVDYVRNEVHLEGHISENYHQRKQVIDLWFFVFWTAFPHLQVRPVFLMGSKSKFGGSGEVSDGKNENFL